MISVRHLVLLATVTSLTIGCQRGERSRAPDVAVRPADSASYQVELLPSFGPPLYATLRRSPAETVATWVRWSQDRTVPVDSGSRRLSPSDWAGLEAHLATAHFWQAQSDRTVCSGDTVCTDGTYWTVTAREGARTQRVRRWSPADTGTDASFRRLVLYMIRVSGAPLEGGRDD